MTADSRTAAWRWAAPLGLALIISALFTAELAGAPCSAVAWLEALALVGALGVELVRLVRRGADPLWGLLLVIALAARGFACAPCDPSWPAIAASAIFISAVALVDRFALRAGRRARSTALVLAAVLALAPLVARGVLGRPALVRRLDAHAANLARAGHRAF